MIQVTRFIVKNISKYKINNTKVKEEINHKTFSTVAKICRNFGKSLLNFTEKYKSAA